MLRVTQTAENTGEEGGGGSRRRRTGRRNINESGEKEEKYWADVMLQMQNA